MKILAVADEEVSYIWDHFDRARFKDVDLIISCGDLKPQYLSFLVTMVKAPLFYVHGNHDGAYTKSPPEGCECIDGKLVNYKGVRILGLGGSFNYNDGKHQFTEAKMRSRIRKLAFKLWLKGGIDMIVTHAPAYKLGDGNDLCHRGFECFNRLMDKYSPKYLLHGHQHLNYGNNKRILQHKDTKIINTFGYYLFDF
ncbi:MAG: metallophosphoesterase [Clostridia bacterium]|nr:metallophosphoesterase [Clostridia bacterium]